MCQCGPTSGPLRAHFVSRARPWAPLHFRPWLQLPRIYDSFAGPHTVTVGECSCAYGGLFLNRYRHLLKDTGLPCCVEAYADRADTYVRTYHATTGQTRPPHTPTSTALRQDCPPPPTPPPHPRLWASSSATASSQLQLQADVAAGKICEQRARRRGRKFGQCGCVCD